MADSPLELYRNAYVLHYREDGIGKAQAVYQSIIRQFPESDEAGYALIQLQKIEAENLTVPEDPAPAKAVKPLLLVSFILNTVALAAILLAFLSYLQILPFQPMQSSEIVKRAGMLTSKLQRNEQAQTPDADSRKDHTGAESSSVNASEELQESEQKQSQLVSEDSADLF